MLYLFDFDAVAAVPETDLAEGTLNGCHPTPPPISLCDRGDLWISPTGEISVPRPERPTFLNIKQHARPLHHQGSIRSGLLL